MKGFAERALVPDVLAWLRSETRPLAPVSCPIGEASGRVLGQPITAPIDVPSFDRSAMDGYALVATATDGASPYNPLSFSLIGESLPGSRFPGTVDTATAARIMTGAPLPEGADAVVMVELTQVEGDQVTVQKTVPEGNHIRRAGEDLESGQVVFEKGTKLTPTHLGVLASIGCLEVSVFSPIKVGVMSTGDEPVEGKVPLEPGQIRDSNRHSLLALLNDLGL